MGGPLLHALNFHLWKIIKNARRTNAWDGNLIHSFWCWCANIFSNNITKNLQLYFFYSAKQENLKGKMKWKKNIWSSSIWEKRFGKFKKKNNFLSNSSKLKAKKSLISGEKKTIYGTYLVEDARDSNYVKINSTRS